MFTESVVVFHRDDSAVNELGETVTKWTPEKVSGVVVRPQTPEDEKNTLMPDGIGFVFVLRFQRRMHKVLSTAELRFRLVV